MTPQSILRRQFRSSLLLLVLLWPELGLATVLFDWNDPGASGQTWPGWTWTTNADGFGSPGWKRNDAIDFGGGGDWRPRTFLKSDCGGGTVATVDTTMRAPSTASGGSLKLTNTSTTLQACWWGLVPADVFTFLGFTDATTNRFSYYALYQGMTDDLRTPDPSNVNVEIGTYIFPDHNVGPGAEVDHFYHQMVVTNNVWMHVVLDRHPQHQRGNNTTVPTDNPDGPTYPYYRNFASFYWDIPYHQASNTTTVWFDEVQFWTQPQPENDISISTVWVGYRATDNHWLLHFEDSSWSGGGGSPNVDYGNSSIGTYEVRWSTTPITNASWAGATTITPLYNAATGSGSGPGRIRRPNSFKAIAYTEFQLPAQPANSTLYFAIKDVSSTTFGDGHNSPSANVKTIDYALRPSASGGGPGNTPLTPPSNLRVK